MTGVSLELGRGGILRTVLASGMIPSGFRWLLHCHFLEILGMNGVSVTDCYVEEKT